MAIEATKRTSTESAGSQSTIPAATRPKNWSLRPMTLWPLASLKPLAFSLRPNRDLEPEIHVLSQDSRRTTLVRIAAIASLSAAVAAGAYGIFASGPAPHALTDRKAVPIVVSGSAQFRESPSGARERWTRAAVTVTLDPSLEGLDPRAKDAVRNAFGTWVSGVDALPPLAFDSGSKPGAPARDGVNLVLYGPITLTGHERDLAITIGYEDAKSGEILEADVVFNSTYAFGVLSPPAKPENDDAYSPMDCDAQYDLQNVATHETGHFFGLGEDIEDSRATMYVRSNPCQTHKRELTEPDRTVMSTLYAGSGYAGSGYTGSSSKQGCGVAAPPSRPAGARGALTAIVLALAARRRRKQAPEPVTRGFRPESSVHENCLRFGSPQALGVARQILVRRNDGCCGRSGSQNAHALERCTLRFGARDLFMVREHALRQRDSRRRNHFRSAGWAPFPFAGVAIRTILVSAPVSEKA
jgi:MYXO-CTERM domain-containing protein